MLRKILNKLSDSLLAWSAGLLVPVLAAFFLLTEPQMHDWYFKARYLFKPDQPVSANLVVLAVATKKANELTKVTPRLYLARLIDSVAQFQPRVIALDYEFLEADCSDPHYPELQRAVAAAGNVILPCLLDVHSHEHRLLSMPPEDLAPLRQTGYVTLESVYDAKLQTQLADQSELPSIALAMVTAYLFPQEYFADQDTAEDLPAKALHTLALPGGESLLPINYAGPIKDKRIAVQDADLFLRSIDSKNFWKHIIADKIVLIGSTLRQADGSDQFETPYGTMFGVEVHANIINTLLTQNYLKPFGVRYEIFFTALSLAIAGLSVWRLRLKSALGVTAGWLLIYTVAGFTLFIGQNKILPLALPLKAGLVGFLLVYTLQRFGVTKRVREFLDFEILLEATEQKNRYRLRVINAPGQAGDAKAETIFKKDQLQKALKSLQRGFTDQASLKNFGRLLYQTLFVDNIAASYGRALTQARLEKKGLRLRLLIDAPELQTLPWEYLYDERNDFFFSANPEILLTRDVVSEQPRREMNVKALNVLIALSNPTPESLFMLALHELEVTDEKDTIVAALKNLRDNTDIPIRYTILEHATADQIRQHLHDDFNVFHFIGHSTFRDGMGKIVLEDDEHEAVFVDEADFGNLFLGRTEMRLVILNSCQSATTAALPTISGLAYQIIQRSIPAVVAMQSPIADETATLFAKEFYRTLAAGHPVDFAMAHARLAIAQKMKATRPHDFGIPVLFMRAREGRIV